MKQHDLDALLMASNPHSNALTESETRTLNGVISETRQPRRRRSGLKVALASIGVVGIVPVALAISTAGSDPRLVPDYRLTVSYIKDTGEQVTCDIEFYNHEINYVETDTGMVDWMKTQDWTGVGQRIYDRAIEIEASMPDDETAAFAWVTASHEIINAGADPSWEYGGLDRCTYEDLH